MATAKPKTLLLARTLDTIFTPGNLEYQDFLNTNVAPKGWVRLSLVVDLPDVAPLSGQGVAAVASVVRRHCTTAEVDHSNRYIRTIPVIRSQFSRKTHDPIPAILNSAAGRDNAFHGAGFPRPAPRMLPDDLGQVYQNQVTGEFRASQQDIVWKPHTRRYVAGDSVSNVANPIQPRVPNGSHGGFTDEVGSAPVMSTPTRSSSGAPRAQGSNATGSGWHPMTSPYLFPLPAKRSRRSPE